MASKTTFWVLIMLPVSDVHVPCVFVAVKVNATSVREVCLQELPDHAPLPALQMKRGRSQQWCCAHGIATTNTLKVSGEGTFKVLLYSSTVTGTSALNISHFGE
jgi:hypothetical protein